VVAPTARSFTLRNFWLGIETAASVVQEAYSTTNESESLEIASYKKITSKELVLLSWKAGGRPVAVALE
jgi:hypothetical protein